ncbi:22600_t:CDS:1 [Racocetra persica]|uniref:22600_t:CDS:1 n=1 Tax=Racocetra persica TaxID=160502 RepID=A0ACA9QIT2_9GLOM|nr:22600_t:CDS:1 [Racocetra persica]
MNIQLERKIDAPDKSSTSSNVRAEPYQNTDDSQRNILNLVESDNTLDRQIFQNAASYDALETDAFQSTELDETSNAELTNAELEDETSNAESEDETSYAESEDEASYAESEDEASYAEPEDDTSSTGVFQNAEPDDTSQTVVEDPFTTLSNLLVLGSSYSYESPPVFSDTGDIYNGFAL